jgi:hypothetical protein
MADAADVRHLALALPDVTEIDSVGLDFRVADKGFVWSYPERRQGKAARHPGRHRGADDGPPPDFHHRGEVR